MTKDGARKLTFGQVLHVVRLRQQVTFEELAELVGWPAARIRTIEYEGGEEVTKAEALELAQALDVDPQVLTVAVHQ